MLQIQCLESIKYKNNFLFSRFSVGPLKKGQAITIGNTLRRVLLSNLKGLAIIGVRIVGINHEFSTIPNVKEDGVEILLNLKQIKLKGDISSPVIARLVYQGPGIVTASDINLPENIELVEPRQYIADLTKKGKLEMEFLIDKGEGYSMGENNISNLPSGFLAVDAVYMPVQKVNFFAETHKDNISSDLENLILEVDTDGSILPKEAVSLAAETLEEIFASLQTTKTAVNLESSVQDNTYEQEDEFNNIPIEDMELSVRAYNCLKRANVYTLADLLKYSKEDLLEFKNFGQKSADEVFESLESRFGKTLRK
jgi:DNA-directed RNA polymerase subunit alpha